MNSPDPSIQELSSPPKPPLVFRIGVVGHRPDRLDHADLQMLSGRLAEVIRKVQTELKTLHTDNAAYYSETAPVVRAISPLAEGVDRIFAEQALDAGCELTAVLPFHQAELENDFTGGQAKEPDSLVRFRALLDRATSVFQLAGDRTDESESYGRAGDVVLNQSDLLIVVWDGARHRRRGGTEDTFDDAVARGVPVVWVDAHAPHHWRIVTRPIRGIEEFPRNQRAALTKSFTWDKLQEQVRRLTEVPADDTEASSKPGKSQKALLAKYLKGRKPKWNLPFVWKWFRNFIGDGSIKLPSKHVPPFEQSSLGAWPLKTGTPVSAMINHLRPYYVWADKLADRYADVYRSAFVTAFTFAAIAVGLALLPNAIGLDESGLASVFCAIGEFLAILIIVVLVVVGRLRRWHERWLDYRLLAEILRHQRMIAPLGGLRASPSVPEHWTNYGDPGSSWMAWYARAVERAIGLPNAVVDATYLRECLDDLHGQLGGSYGQVAFHETTAARSKRIEHRLHLAEYILFALTLVCCSLHISHGVFHWPHINPHWLTFFCGFFPALGAAIAGLSNQAEFRRVAQRSKSMHAGLKVQLEQVEQLRNQLAKDPDQISELTSTLTEVASNSATMMVNEVLDWRVIFQDRPLRTV